MKVALITPTIPGREALLEQAKASARAQTRPPDLHVVALDHDRIGPGETRNAAVRALDPEFTWIGMLDDDDVLYPHHFATLCRRTQNADVIYGPYDAPGWPPGILPAHRCGTDHLSAQNTIPVTVLMRRSAFEAVGGFPPRRGPVLEDWQLWIKMAREGYRFRCVHGPATWRYRFSPDSRTFGDPGAP